MDASGTNPRARVAVIIGTRPEALKLAPVVAALRASNTVCPEVVYSGQHAELLESVLSELALDPMVDLRGTRRDDASPSSLAHLLDALGRALADRELDGVVVQGDTNTTLAGALAAYHLGLPVFHVEAGLRTDDARDPFPEEMNRRLVSRIAALHLAPTESARRNLLAEGVEPHTVVVTGNPIIDAVDGLGRGERVLPWLDALGEGTQLVVVTLHRSESVGKAGAIAAAIRRVAERRPSTEVVWLLHRNPARREIEAALAGARHVRAVEPLPHGAFLSLLRRATVVLTDSGGVQEEAPALGVPVLLLRRRTERPEAVELGCCRIVGLDPGYITESCLDVLDDPARRAAMAHPARPFGDGRAAERIAAAISTYFRARAPAPTRLS